ncbi:MAG: efflux RND transporter periplasmic adaptor subunit [Phycisphaerales bacterium]|nr:efflux RND transporter periplasmic adaptor subunit [Phycisphaerales bacterium]
MRVLKCWSIVPILLLAACDAERKPSAPPPPVAPTVHVQPARRETIPLSLEFSSTLEAIRTVRFIPRVSGYVMSRPFVEGAEVKEGDLLYQIDPRPFEAQLTRYQAQLASNLALQDYQDAELKRAEKAFKEGALSENERLQYIANAKEAVAAVEATKAMIVATKLDLEYARITAPFAGRVQDTLIDEGNLVTAEQTILTSLVQLDPIYALFNVSREQLDAVQTMIEQGLVAGANGPDTWKAFKATVHLRDGSAYPKDGHLDFVAARIDPQTDMLLARAVFPNPGDGAHGITLIPGQYVRLVLHLGERPDALLVPQAAISETPAGTFVFVVDDQSNARRKPVTIGAIVGTNVVVEKGLEAGDRVISSGTQLVSDGARVKVAADDK